MTNVFIAVFIACALAPLVMNIAVIVLQRLGFEIE